jgi:hypothetical protein
MRCGGVEIDLSVVIPTLVSHMSRAQPDLAADNASKRTDSRKCPEVRVRVRVDFLDCDDGHAPNFRRFRWVQAARCCKQQEKNRASPRKVDFCIVCWAAAQDCGASHDSASRWLRPSRGVRAALKQTIEFVDPVTRDEQMRSAVPPLLILIEVFQIAQAGGVLRAALLPLPERGLRRVVQHDALGHLRRCRVPLLGRPRQRCDAGGKLCAGIRLADEIGPRRGFTS